MCFVYLVYVFCTCVKIHYYLFEYKHKTQVIKQTLLWDGVCVMFIRWATRFKLLFTHNFTLFLHKMKRGGEN
jgi:hypothetical protein